MDRVGVDPDREVAIGEEPERQAGTRGNPEIQILISFFDQNHHHLLENIATGETSPAITPFHFFGISTSLTFVTR